MANVWFLSVAALVVHSILFASIFDIYFTSPVETGMVPQRYSADPPAKRLVLFVADGLRADTVFSSGKSRAPFLRRVIETRGRWGVSHTHVPTESRPGHVAIIAGLHEDVSAVTRGWRENPVHFDSVFNRSARTWAWGSPDILPMFRAGAVPGLVETHTYEGEMEDFAGEDPSSLDTWVFAGVKKFFEEARHNATHAALAGERGVVFFLHLLGLDTNGHAHKPDSAEVLGNLRLVDKGVEQMVDLFERYYGDNSTTYVFTSDHGMTDWGSHGAGLPQETMTPLVCWGAGIKGPRSAHHSSRVYHDGYSEAWQLEGYERLDVEQVDIAPLMATLVGVAIPVNSLGVLPLGYLHYNQPFLAEALLSNARQLGEQVRVKGDRTREGSLPLAFRPFPGLLPSDLLRKVGEIQTLIDAHQVQRALDLTHGLVALCKEAVRYYHTYHRPPLMAAITAGFVGWLACVLVAILEDSHYSPSPPAKEWRPIGGADPTQAVLVLVAMVMVVAMVLWYQHPPPQYYLYYFLPLCCWTYVWARRKTLLVVWQHVATNRMLFFRGAAILVTVVMGLEALVVSFFYREVLSLLLLVLPLLPCLSPSPSRSLCALWIPLCVSLALFPLLPVGGRSTNLILASAPGLFLCVGGALLLTHPASRSLLAPPRGPRGHAPIILLWVQVALVGVASLVPSVTHWFFAHKQSIPLLVHTFSWLALVTSIFAPLLGPARLPGRLGHTLLCLTTVFALMSTSYEAIFVLLLFATLLVWLGLEAWLRPVPSPSLWHCDLTFRTSTSRPLSMLPSDSFHGNSRAASLEDVRRAWLCLFLGLLSFFGMGNVASLNTFDLAPLYPLVTVFSPFLMASLLILKMAVPFVFVSAVFNVVLCSLGRPLGKTLLIMLAMSDLMGLNFFFLVRDCGSWLEIGVSISHYVIMMVMTVAVVILMGVARLLTGVAVVPSKSHPY